MESTRFGTHSAAPSIFAREPFLELRELYCTQLRGDRVQLSNLCAQLAQGDSDPTRMLTEIRLVAHRIRGAAALFEFPTVAGAAGTLEEATLAASSQRPDRSNVSVWNALETLVERLAQVTGSSTA